ncbi:MAG TPA: lactate utilization protein C [Ktedonobacterales bacterium]|jgi:L-lactate dehydrogenase complex protein LldG
MSEAKETILARIRQATGQAPEIDAAGQRTYHTASGETRAAIIDAFAERVLEYRAALTRVDEKQLAASLAAACAERGVKRLVAPADLPDAWLPAGVEVRRDQPPLSYADLDASDGALTGCRLALAQTGTIVLDGGARQGRRALSLVPDLHFCIVLEAQIVGLVPEAIAGLAGNPTQPITFISGPSATSDIELNRVEGVHGPRTLHVFVVLGERV